MLVPSKTFFIALMSDGTLWSLYKLLQWRDCWIKLQKDSILTIRLSYRESNTFGVDDQRLHFQAELISTNQCPPRFIISSRFLLTRNIKPLIWPQAVAHDTIWSSSYQPVYLSCMLWPNPQIIWPQGYRPITIDNIELDRQFVLKDWCSRTICWIPDILQRYLAVYRLLICPVLSATLLAVCSVWSSSPNIFTPRAKCKPYISMQISEFC